MKTINERIGKNHFDLSQLANSTKVILLTIIAISTISCNKKSKNEGGETPTQQIAQDEVPDTDNNKEDDNSEEDASKNPKDSNYRPLAVCNSGRWEDFQVNVQAVKDAQGKEYQMDVRVARFAKIPDRFSTESMAVAFFKWKVGDTNQATVHPTALKFAVVDTATSETIISSATTLKWKKLSDYATKNKVSYRDLMNRLNFLIQTEDSKSEFQGMEATVYNVTTDGKFTIIGNMAFITPLFLASPVQYRDGKTTQVPPTFLQYYHPFSEYVEYAYSPEEFLKMSQEYCF